jgi:hypothetical protein
MSKLKAYYFSKMARKKFAEKTIKIISEIMIIRYTCTAVALCFPNIF